MIWTVYVNLSPLQFQTDKSVVQFKGLHTGGSAASGDSNKLKVTFNAMLAPVPDLGNNEERYIVAGVEYSDSAFVWIGNVAITTKLDTTVSHYTYSILACC